MKYSKVTPMKPNTMKNQTPMPGSKMPSSARSESDPAKNTAGKSGMFNPPSEVFKGKK